jgi:hypothetical protein
MRIGLRHVFVVGLLLVSAALVGTPSQWLRAQTSTSNSETLQGLIGQTGWIVLGVLTADQKEWAAGFGDPNVPYLTGTYEIVGKDTDSRAPILPTIGERIRLTTRSRVVIVDYAKLGESRALEAPAGPSLSPNDWTEIWLQTGTVVQVQDVQRVSPLGDRIFVWARVTPSND